ncbi:hypothetical protein BD779DRAFT_1469895 [Infundibulicybe gibba]|nr:hypothetical protein BD779DRAFT_1469895 [Infundibulicybe gibba]
MSTKPSKGIIAMPGVASNKAPTFSGETSELLEFLDYFEELADGYQLSEPERCKSLVRYVDQSTKRFWISLEGFGTHNYQKFKEAILDQYPVLAKITSETELRQYYRKFRPMAVWLIANNKLSEGERNRYFWYGLHPSTRRQIDRRLELKEPNYTRAEATDMEKVMAAGRFVFSDEAFDAVFDDPIANRLKKDKEEEKGRGRGRKSRRVVRDWDSEDSEDSEEEERPKKKKETVEREVRTRKVELEGGKDTLDEVEELAKKLHGLQVHDVAYSGYYARLVCLAPAVAQHWKAPGSHQSTVPPAGNPNSIPIQNSTSLPYNGYQLQPYKTISAHLRLMIPMHHSTPHAISAKTLIIAYVSAPRCGAVIDERFGGPLLMPQAAVGQRDMPPHLATTSAFFQCDLVNSNAAVWEVGDKEGDGEAGEELESGGLGAITRAQAKEGEKTEEKRRGKGRVEEQEKKSEEVKKAVNPESRADPSPLHVRCKIASPEAARTLHERILSAVVPNVTVGELLALSGDLRKETVEQCRTTRIPNNISTAAITNNEPGGQPPVDIRVDHATALRELEVILSGGHVEKALLDEGSEIVVIRKDLRDELKLKTNGQVSMTMETANGGSEQMGGCVEWMEIKVDGLTTWAHAYVVPNAPYRLLLGRPWQRHVLLKKVEDSNGNVFITLSDPTNRSNTRTVPTTARPWSKKKGTFAMTVGQINDAWSALGGTAVVTSVCNTISVPPPKLPPPALAISNTTLAEYILRENFAYDTKVANKVRPVATTMPEDARIHRRFPEDPLLSLPELSPHPPDFTPGIQAHGTRLQTQ